MKHTLLGFYIVITTLLLTPAEPIESATQRQAGKQITAFQVNFPDFPILVGDIFEPATSPANQRLHSPSQNFEKAALPAESSRPQKLVWPAGLAGSVDTAQIGWKWNPPGSVHAPILLYHRIESRPVASRFNVSPEDFRLQMEMLVKWGYTAIPISMLVEALNTGAYLPEKPVVITFDDGQRSVFDHAFPIMQDLGLTGVVYLVSTGIYSDKNLMGVEQIQELIAAGWEIGSHTRSHANLPEQAGHLDGEIRLSKLDLETVLKVDAATIAYPFGLMDEGVVAKVVESGYTAAVGLGKSWEHSSDTRWYLSRIEIHGTFDINKFASILPPIKEGQLHSAPAGQTPLLLFSK